MERSRKKAKTYRQEDRYISPFDLVLFLYRLDSGVLSVMYSLNGQNPYSRDVGGLRSGRTEMGLIVVGGVHPIFSVGADSEPVAWEVMTEVMLIR
jgi:hypothetical protein